MSKNIKEIGKELMGNTLNSFHRKAGIKKLNENNKMQDGILDGILSQADNPYRGHSETGNVIHLEGSGDGVVVLGDIEGNTMVNHCLDGSKELILNGDIDTEGTFITTTEGADGGLVDVMCEGHTAVNISKTKDKTAITTKYSNIVGNEGRLLVGDVANKAGYVEVERVVGNTLVNIHPTQTYNFNYNTSVDSALVTISNGLNYVKAEFLSTLTSWSCIALGLLDMNVIKPNTKYSIIFKKSIGIKTIRFDNSSATAKISSESTINNNIAVITTTDFINLGIDISKTILYGAIDRDTCLKIDVEDAIILEGDYTNKPIPSELFHGLQSSFESNLVTEEMVTQGLENAENLGKYKVPVKLVGKNKLNVEYVTCNTNSTEMSINNNQLTFKRIQYSSTQGRIYLGKFKEGKYTISFNSISMSANNLSLHSYDNNNNELDRIKIVEWYNRTGVTSFTFTLIKDSYLSIETDGVNSSITLENIQIEEGTVATDYEEYFECTTDIYLNSPLLEGDEIVMKDGELCHYHKCIKEILTKDRVSYSNVSFYSSETSTAILISSKYTVNLSTQPICDLLPSYPNSYAIWQGGTPVDKGISTVNTSWCVCVRLPNSDTGLTINSTDSEVLAYYKNYIANNPLTIVYELAEPYYEVISSDKLLLECANNSTLHIDTVVPTQLITFKSFEEEISMLEANTEYRVSFRSDKENIPLNITLGGASITHTTSLYNTLLITTPATLTNNLLVIDGQGCQISECVITKGNMEYPYFEDMKSVGQDDVGGHKVEILSQNNLADIATSGNTNFEVANIKIGKTYTIKFKRSDNTVRYNLISKPSNIRLKENVSSDLITFTSIANEKLFYNGYVPVDISEIMLVEGAYTESTMPAYKPYASNKKEVSLSEPLRDVKDYKDRVVKINNKSYIERNCISVTYDGINNTMIRKWEQFDTDEIAIFGASISNIVKDNQQVKCDKLKIMTLGDLTKNPNTEFFTNQNGNTEEIGVGILKTKLGSLDTNGINSYLQTNPITVVIGLKTPIYEPLEIEPTLNAYTDTTHISNNSIIPCNMKVKNTGYNVIIKPSTLYTVAVDTDKDGTIGIDISGTKITTTNNVTTITTPATLTDDSLRLYGRGIKGSKVRFIEGDKTNWVPGYFEGMMSSFEDKAMESDKYEIKFLSYNKNLLDATPLSSSGGDRVYLKCVLKPNTDYKLSFSDAHFNAYRVMLCSKELDSTNKNIELMQLNTGGSTVFNSRNYGGEFCILFHTSGAYERYINQSVWIQLEEGTAVNSYIPYKQNKIEFLINEPLRSATQARDRLCVKEGKLVIERNCEEVILNEQLNYNKANNGDNTYVGTVSCQELELKPNSKNYACICDKLPYLSANEDTPHIRTNGSKPYGNIAIYINKIDIDNAGSFADYFKSNPMKAIFARENPRYEEVLNEYGLPIMLEGYENGTVYIETEMAPTVNLKYTPKMESFTAYKEVSSDNENLTNNISNNVITYMMEIDSKIVEKELNTPVLYSVARVQSNMQERTKDMLIRLFEGGSLTKEQCLERIELYSIAGKINEQHVEELTDLVNNIYK